MTFGTLGALSTLVWSLAVATGAGQMIAVLKTNLLFLNDPFTVTQFSFVNMVLLVLGSFVGLYIWGWVAGYIYNWYE